MDKIYINFFKIMFVFGIIFLGYEVLNIKITRSFVKEFDGIVYQDDQSYESKISIQGKLSTRIFSDDEFNGTIEIKVKDETYEYNLWLSEASGSVKKVYGGNIQEKEWVQDGSNYWPDVIGTIFTTPKLKKLYVTFNGGYSLAAPAKDFSEAKRTEEEIYYQMYGE